VPRRPSPGRQVGTQAAERTKPLVGSVFCGRGRQSRIFREPSWVCSFVVLGSGWCLSAHFSGTGDERWGGAETDVNPTFLSRGTRVGARAPGFWGRGTRLGVLVCFTSIHVISAESEEAGCGWKSAPTWLAPPRGILCASAVGIRDERGS